MNVVVNSQPCLGWYLCLYTNHLNLASILALILVDICFCCATFQSEPLYVPVKFHDLPSEKPENTNIDTEKGKQNLEFHYLEMGGNFSCI